MITLLKYVTEKIFKWPDYALCKEEDIQNILEEWQSNIAADNRVVEEPNALDSKENKCFHKKGRVTHVSNDSVMIEKKYACSRSNVAFQDIKVGDLVSYYAYSTTKGEKLKISKIDSKIEEGWEGKNSDEEWGSHREESTDMVVKSSSLCTRVVIGKVKGRDKRIFNVDIDNGCEVQFNLDDTHPKFGVPVIGDYLNLTCLVEFNEHSPESIGIILEVQSVDPLLSNVALGKITMYNEAEKYGSIDKKYLFNKASCQVGYVPCMGDKVTIWYLESEQFAGGCKYNFRAIQVTPLEERSRRYLGANLQVKPLKPVSDLESFQENKDGIEITNNISVVLSAQEQKIINIEVVNVGDITIRIKKCSIYKRQGTQLKLENAEQYENFILKPPTVSHEKCKVIYNVKCIGSFVGTSEEWLCFEFQSTNQNKYFKIARKIQIQVNSIHTENETAGEKVYHKLRSNYKVEKPYVYEPGQYIPGVRPNASAKFIAKRSVTFCVPPYMWEIVLRIKNERKTRAEAELIAQEEIPHLGNALEYGNYQERFHQLLYLEDIAQQLAIDQYEMSSGILRHSQEYLVLTVPGLAEKRPSLIIGDKAILSFKWDASKDKKSYEGFIHKVRASDIFLKFHNEFHERYNGEDTIVKFKCSKTVINRCHNAVLQAYKNLGKDVLFPVKVEAKKPQYNIVETHQSGEEFCADDIMLCNEHIDPIIQAENILKRRKLVWVNKYLNVYQRKAVVNILKGIARPLPYIIFGPPGTGKTVTLCETILQILMNVSNSRILVATPSNSSANLITERLLDSGILKPGDLVRLVAHNYIESENLPERILPFCATAELASEGTKQNVNRTHSRGYKSNCTISYLGRHRISVGTCSALGIFYNMGFPKDHFSHVLVDEAGQATEPEIMIPLSLVQASTAQIVLAGDAMQLGPVNISRLASYFGLSESYLSRLLQQFPYQRDPEGFQDGYDSRLVTKLLFNYRSLPEILKLPNELFYDSELIPQICPVKSDEAQLLHNLRNILPQRLGDPPAVIFHGIEGENKQDFDSPSWYNPKEATQVYIYIQKLLDNGLHPEDIGIITPYDKQVRIIRNLLRDFLDEIPKVGTVEEFQGQERKVIILSTVRSREDILKHDITHALGFVSAPKRLNVAITRARSLLVIIGNPFLLEQDNYWRSVIKYCYLNYAYCGSNNYVLKSETSREATEDNTPLKSLLKNIENSPCY